MAVPPVPSPLDQIGQRPFSFYPSILNIEHNEWSFRSATWAEIQVLNTKSRQEIWVPRRFLGDVSAIEEPVVIVGLLKELEYKAGAVWPRERRVIEMPKPAVPALPSSTPVKETVAPVVGIRLETGTESRIGRLMLAAIAVGIVACVLVVSFFRGGVVGNRVAYTTVLQSDVPFIASDDYYSIVRRWGPPAADRWRPASGELKYRLLQYPQAGLSLILMQSDPSGARYVGAMDAQWRVVHSVPWPGGKDSASILHSLKPF